MSKQVAKQKTVQKTKRTKARTTTPRAKRKVVQKTVQKITQCREPIRQAAGWLWDRRDKFVMGCAVFIVLTHIPLPVPAKWATKFS